MSEEKRKKIPIEDGNEESKAKEEELKDEELETVTEEAESEAEAGAETEAEEEASKEETEGADEAEANAEEQESERYMRLMAEFQNFKRRAAKEKSDIHAFANERIVNDLLPVLDNFERALATKIGSGGDEAENYAKGMELIFEQLKTALEKAGVKEIAAQGEDFDPAVHNAVMTEQSEEFEDGKVSKVLQKGYTLNDKVVRPAMVAVVKN